MDALLIVSFGGPEGPDDVVPFLERVTRGRGIPRERLVEVGAHYTHFAGVSPINAQNRALVAAVRGELDQRGETLPVLWGNRNWHPLLPEALREARDLGATRVFAFLTSAYSSYSGCRQYRENLAEALAEVQAEDPAWQPQVHKLRTYWNHPGFVEPVVEATRAALAELPPGARLVFTTHSIPTADADRCDYVAQHRDLAEVVASAVGRPGAWDLVYQSRSGAPHVPWLEPDISDHLAALARAGVPGAAMVPIGFVSDHMEVIWDLDTVAAQTAADVGLPVARAATPGTDPRFVAMVADLLAEQRAAADGASEVARPALGGLGPRVTPCAPGCCPNPRGPRPALCGSDPA
ncbi:MAG: ferrochelatase [Candidatus Nanopelagicales bacterium]|nr:ferrochelatase [Candidatus Nanopelagicales bacterium]